MAKLTSQNSSKSKSAKSKTTTEEKKPKDLGKKAAFAVRKISQLATKDKVRPEASAGVAHFRSVDQRTLWISVQIGPCGSGP